MILFEFDLAGAEWVVVAYLSQDKNMLDVVASGKSPHVVTGALICGVPEDFVIEEHKLVGSNSDAGTIEQLRRRLKIPTSYRFIPRVMSIRQAGKKSNHGLNYNMRYRRFALENEMLEADAQPIVEAYSTKAYPGIQDYWAGIRKELKDNKRCLVNCWGRKVHLRDEWGETLFNQAYSFKPQSTVVDIVNRAMRLAYKDHTDPFRKMFLGAQVHDSLLVQSPVPGDFEEWIFLAAMVRKIKEEYMRPRIDYGNQAFWLGCDMKMGLNWGNMHEVKLPVDLEAGANALRRAYHAAASSGQGTREDLPLEEARGAEVVYLSEALAARDRRLTG